jgi:hypothetical protein
MQTVQKQLDESKTQQPPPPPPPPLLDVFRARCEARAYLVVAVEYTLSEAVDRLQADAVKSGLVDLIGQDAVQQIMAAAFAKVRDDEPEIVSTTNNQKNSAIHPEGYCDVCGCEPCRTVGFCKACREADNDPNVIAERERASAKLPPNWDQISFEALSALLNNPARLSRKGRAARSTVDAVAYALRKGGTAALKAQTARLREFSDRQIVDLIKRLNAAGADRQLLRILVGLLP